MICAAVSVVDGGVEVDVVSDIVVVDEWEVVAVVVGFLDEDQMFVVDFADFVD